MVNYLGSPRAVLVGNRVVAQRETLREDDGGSIAKLAISATG